jgi:hypothetical protein
MAMNIESQQKSQFLSLSADHVLHLAVGIQRKTLRKLDSRKDLALKSTVISACVVSDAADVAVAVERPRP